jgi:hypothetical protein
MRDYYTADARMVKILDIWLPEFVVDDSRQLAIPLPPFGDALKEDKGG